MGASPFAEHARPGAASDLRVAAGIAQGRAMIRKMRKHWLSALERTLGPGDPKRRTSARNMLMVGPWLTFVWMLLVWTILVHYSASLAVFLTVITVFLAVGMLCCGLYGRFPKFNFTSPTPLGCLSLLAIGVGFAMGAVLWTAFWQEYWWIQTGRHTQLNSASTPAEVNLDAAVIGFWNASSDEPVNSTAVDYQRSAGYKSKHYFCAAPILDIDEANASLKTVNYWAIGIDCCQGIGDFTCDDSRNFQGGYGVVLLHGGYPNPSWHQAKFQKAIQKATAAHGLVSDDNAKLVRWVASPSSVENQLLSLGLGYIALVALCGLVLFFFVGYYVWYLGIGLTVTFATLFGGKAASPTLHADTDAEARSLRPFATRGIGGDEGRTQFA